MIDSANYNEKDMFPPIIAVDFDGTLVENKFPEIGAINTDVWAAVKAAQDIGYRVILWTCRTEDMLEAAIEFCRQNGLEFDEVNHNIPEVIAVYGGDTRKVFANYYLDDRSAGFHKEYGFLPIKPITG